MPEDFEFDRKLSCLQLADWGSGVCEPVVLILLSKAYHF